MPDRPKTLIIHHRSGIGDLVWHIPYFRAIAAISAGGKASLVARPSARAGDLLAAEDWVEQLFEFDRRPRRSECRRGRHDGLWAQLKFVGMLRRHRYQRVYIFSGRARYAWLAAMAGISQRYGFGFGLLQRLWLNHPPYIAPHSGNGSWVYPEATAFALAHGLCDVPLVPRMKVLEPVLESMKTRLEPLPRPLVGFAVGASDPVKNWGGERFRELAQRLTNSGCGVVLLGGPAERELVENIHAAMAPARRARVLPFAQASLQHTAAVLRLCNCCVGNDTGVLNMAAANRCPAVGLFGATLPLAHDPLITGIAGPGMAAISVNAVERRLHELLTEAAIPA
jgi:heptosyltransferase-2